MPPAVYQEMHASSPPRLALCLSHSPLLAQSPELSCRTGQSLHSNSAFVVDTEHFRTVPLHVSSGRRASPRLRSKRSLRQPDLHHEEANLTSSHFRFTPEYSAPRSIHKVDKPLPSAPLASLSAKDSIRFLNLLDKLDEEVNREVARVKDLVFDARTLLSEYRSERNARVAAFKKKCERERRETKAIDSDFWLGVY